MLYIGFPNYLASIPRWMFICSENFFLFIEIFHKLNYALKLSSVQRVTCPFKFVNKQWTQENMKVHVLFPTEPD